MMVALLGWVATAVFAISYFFRRASTLTKIQAAGACLWIIYGMKISAAPVVVANMLVAGAALSSLFRGKSFRPSEEEADRRPVRG
jgi:hypothetical protein